MIKAARKIRLLFVILCALLLLAELFVPFLFALFSWPQLSLAPHQALIEFVPNIETAMECAAFRRDRNFAQAYLIGYFEVTIVVLPTILVSTYLFGLFLGYTDEKFIAQIDKQVDQRHLKALGLSLLISLIGANDILHAASATFFICERSSFREAIFYPIMLAFGLGYSVNTWIASFFLGVQTSSFLGRNFRQN